MSSVTSLRPDVAPTDELIPLDGGATVRARIYRPEGRAPAPLVLHFHAGAFVAGDLDSGSRVAGLLAEAGAVVVSLDYPLAPERPFPAAIEVGHAALEWTWRRRLRLAGTASGLWVAGEEAGGNIAAAVALMARDRQHPPLAGQILLSPMLDTCVATASLRSAQAGPVGCRWADGWHDYLSQPEDALHPYAAPGRALRLGDLPPTLLVTADDDPMRDETHAYAARLRAAGVPVTEAVLPGRTGWPCSCMQAADGERPAWAAPLGLQLSHFLSTQPASLSAPHQLETTQDLP